jgi:hypothetical protein
MTTSGMTNYNDKVVNIEIVCEKITKIFNESQLPRNHMAVAYYACLSAFCQDWIKDEPKLRDTIIDIVEKSNKKLQRQLKDRTIGI